MSYSLTCTNFNYQQVDLIPGELYSISCIFNKCGDDTKTFLFRNECALGSHQKDNSVFFTYPYKIKIIDPAFLLSFFIFEKIQYIERYFTFEPIFIDTLTRHEFFFDNIFFNVPDKYMQGVEEARSRRSINTSGLLHQLYKSIPENEISFRATKFLFNRCEK